MAETFISPVIEKLVGLLDEEIKSLKGVDGEVRSLKDELQIIQPLLKEAEAKSEKEVVSDTVREWLKQLREEASRMEDLIDKYRYHLGQRRSRSGFTSFLFKAWHFIKALKPRHEIAAEIQTVKQSLAQLKRIGRDYGLTPLGHGPGHGTIDFQAPDPRLQSLFLEKDELVGIEPQSMDLIAKLVEGVSSRLIIALVGEGGVGKTTLARKVYDDVVKRHFGSARAWITVSRPYNPMKVLKEMKIQICKSGDCVEGETGKIEDLIVCLKTYLHTKRYVIFLDDVWEENFWGDIKHALPNNNEGSRIIITTRNAAVANSCKETSYDLDEIKLSPWSSTLARELFRKKAFKEFQGKCPSELERVSNEIVMKCHGLPLVVASIASLLATKRKEESEWERVLDDLSSKVEMDSQFPKIQQILSLSYYDLPYHLRSCLMYFGVFPEDNRISDEKLFRLWIADGLVKEKGNRTLAEVAEEYLFELTKRNLVSFYPCVAGCHHLRVHDLMRDVILSRADDNCFCQTWDEKKKRCRGKGRRLTITGSTEDVLEKVESSGVRSIFLFDVDDHQLTESFMRDLFKKFKLLEVLDVDNAPVDTLPKELGKLLCLKYLSLRNTRVKVLPKSIGKLHNLESLDIRDSLICELPKEINKLTNLQHLLASGLNLDAQSGLNFARGVAINEGIGQLEDLQSLTLVEASIGGVRLMKELEKLTKLRWLGISKLTKEICRALCTSIGKMDHLKRLVLRSVDENEVLDLQYISSPPRFLDQLVLDGRLEKLPEWILKLQNLRYLALGRSMLIDELGKCLKGLPNLESLSVVDQAYAGERLHFEEHSFRKLKRLVLKQLSRLQLVEVDTEALPVLEELIIDDCLLLKEVHSIQHLANLKYAEVNGTPVN